MTEWQNKQLILYVMIQGSWYTWYTASSDLAGKLTIVYSFSPIILYTRMNFYRKESVSRTYQSYPEQLLQRLCHANVTQRYTDVIRNILIKSDKPWESRSVANPIPISLQEWFVARVRWISRASLIHIRT